MRRFLPFIVLVFLVMAQPLQGQTPCNGDPNLCGRRYDQVCYATTHNAFNYQGAFAFPNQSFGISRQMQDGVRALMLDVYWLNGQPTVYHSSNWLGSQPLSSLLGDIKTFLDGNPNEILTIIFESYITSAQMADAFGQAQLISYLHTQVNSSPWPTLDSMIARNQRLVVLTDANDGQGYPWYHYMWDYAVETDYTAHSRSDFSCTFNRGDSANSLFILNHFITQDPLGYGLIDSAAAVNAQGYLLPRSLGCQAATGKLPNFLTVDFHEQGDLIQVKDILNGTTVGTRPMVHSKNHWLVYPVPSAGTLWIETTHAGPILAGVSDLQGRRLAHWELQGPKGSIELPASFPNGSYLLEMHQDGKTAYQRVLLNR